MKTPAPKPVPAKIVAGQGQSRRNRSRSWCPIRSSRAAERPAGGRIRRADRRPERRGEAEAIAKRLTSKGYAAYVLVPSDGTPSVYRVRIGKFPTRREAETVAAKLKKEEQFKPWVTR